MKKLVMSVSVCSVLLAASAAVPVSAAAANKNAVNSTSIKAASYGYAALIDGRYATSIRQYTRAIESRKLPTEKLARALLNRALAFQKTSNYNNAIKDYTSALSLDALSPKMRAVALYNRGLANQKFSRSAQAIEDFTNALFLDPKFAQAYYSRGNVLREHGQYLFALADYKKARINKHPSPHLTYLAEALAYESLHQITRAKMLLLKAVTIKPGFKAARLKLATIGKAVPLPTTPAKRKRVQVASLDTVTIPQTLVTGSLRQGESDLIIQKNSLPKPVSVPTKMHKAEPVTKMPPLPQVPALPKTAKVPAIKVPAIKLPAPVSVAAINKKPVTLVKAQAQQPKPTLVKANTTRTEGRLQGWTVQISSQRNSDAAWDVWKNLQSKYSRLLKDKTPFVAKADLGTRGIFYRLRVHKLNSKKDAARLCGQLKRKGTGCFISKA